MQQIMDRYRDEKTPKGHDIRVDSQKDGGAIVWYLHWGEYQGVDGHHDMGIATVRPEKSGFGVGTLHGVEQTPYTWKTVKTMSDVFATIDKLVSDR
jgi:hypothetical protein